MPSHNRKKDQVDVEPVAVLQRNQCVGDPRQLVERERETPERFVAGMMKGRENRFKLAELHVTDLRVAERFGHRHLSGNLGTSR